MCEVFCVGYRLQSVGQETHATAGCHPNEHSPLVGGPGWEAGATKRSLGSRRYKALYCQRRMMSVALMPPKPKELERPMSNLCAMALFGT